MKKFSETFLGRYSIGLAVVTVITGAWLGLSYLDYKISMIIPLLIGLIVVAWYGGRGPGIMTIVLIMGAAAIRNPISPEASYGRLILGYVTLFSFLTFIVWLVAGRKTASLNNKNLRRQNDLLLNAAGEGIVGIDVDGNCNFLNPAAAAMFGWDMSELHGKRLHDLVHHTKLDGTPYAADECPIRAACHEDRVEHSTGDVFWRKDGSSFPVEYTSTPICEDGRNTGAVVVFRDITEQRRREIELRQQALLVEQSHEAIFVWDFERGITQWNAGSERLYGFTREEALGQVSYEMLKTVFPVSREKFLSELREKGWWNGEVRQHTKNGDQVVSSSRYQVIELGGREIVLQTNRDITDTKRAEEALRELNDTLEGRVKERTAQLEAANKELEAFSYSVSHDLRAPLRAIDGFSRILVEEYSDKLDSEGQRILNIVRSNAQNMGQLIDDLLAFSRLGRKDMEAGMIDMQRLAHEVSNELNSRSELSVSPFHIDPLPAACGDPALMRQVFVNLFSNALKYSMSKPTVNIQVGSQTASGENIYFVRDSGVGFDMKYADKLFGVFQRLHNPEEFEGTGVGLAIVQRVIHRHGGRVWADGEVGQGATFYFSLPQTYSANEG